MVSDALVQYVNQTRKDFSDDDIRAKLKASGHREEAIKAAFAAAEPRLDESAPSPAPKKPQTDHKPMSRGRKMVLSGLFAVLLVLLLVLAQRVFLA